MELEFMAFVTWISDIARRFFCVFAGNRSCHTTAELREMPDWLGCRWSFIGRSSDATEL